MLGISHKVETRFKGVRVGVLQKTFSKEKATTSACPLEPLGCGGKSINDARGLVRVLDKSGWSLEAPRNLKFEHSVLFSATPDVKSERVNWRQIGRRAADAAGTCLTKQAC